MGFDVASLDNECVRYVCGCFTKVKSAADVSFCLVIITGKHLCLIDTNSLWSEEPEHVAAGNGDGVGCGSTTDLDLQDEGRPIPMVVDSETLLCRLAVQGGSRKPSTPNLRDVLAGLVTIHTRQLRHSSVTVPDPSMDGDPDAALAAHQDRPPLTTMCLASPTPTTAVMLVWLLHHSTVLPLSCYEAHRAHPKNPSLTQIKFTPDVAPAPSLLTLVFKLPLSQTARGPLPTTERDTSQGANAIRLAVSRAVWCAVLYQHETRDGVSLVATGWWTDGRRGGQSSRGWGSWRSAILPAQRGEQSARSILLHERWECVSRRLSHNDK